MEQFQLIYFKISLPLIIVVLLLIYKYVYGFSVQRIKKWIPIVIAISILISGFFITEESLEINLLSVLLLFEMLLFLAVPKRRFRHMFWIWPLICTAILPSGFLILVYVAIFGNAESNLLELVETLLGDAITFGILVVLWKLDSKNHFTRRIRSMERFVIGITSSFLTIVIMGVEGGEFISKFGKYALIINWIAIGAYILIIYIMIQMLIQGNSAQFYLESSKLNEKYIEEEVKHFEAYKKMQEETRKIRHDMKNHLACIQILLDDNKQEELGTYIKDLSVEVAKLEMEQQTNNSMVDAIISSKKKTAQDQGIVIVCEGDISSINYVKAIDWCKIFANAIDNAIEALISLEKKADRALFINIKQNSNFVLISFRNKCNRPPKRIGNKIISLKEDCANHGFGIDSIMQTVQSYHGDTNIVWEPEDEIWNYTLEILLPIKITT